MTQPKCVKTHPLVPKVKEMLAQRPSNLTYQQIEVDTGISIAWLVSFASKDGFDPSFSRIANLYEYLSGKKIEAT